MTLRRTARTPRTEPPPRTADARLDAARRGRELATLDSGEAGRVDLVVVGGGVTGAGIALDAASRGLRTVLLEARDLAFGTSRWSSKLAHGGLRYLATGNVGIARRSAVERGRLLSTTAPHLTRPLAQVVPVFTDTPAVGAVLPRLGFVAGDALARLAGTPTSALPRARTVGAAEVERLVPGVRHRGLRAGHVNWDCQLVDDARLVTALARTAAAHGATVLTRCRVDAADGRNVEFTDTLDGSAHRLSARAVVNATGVWAAGLDEEIAVRPSRGTHLVVDAARVGNPTGALTVPVPGSVNRFCFVLPQDFGRVYVGLTDIDAPGPVPDEPRATQEEVDFLLDVVGAALQVPLTRDDVLASFSGLRPLVDTGDGETADLSREHCIRADANGLLTVTGGKLTEYRLMAEQVVDRVVADSGAPAGPCRTTHLPLVGAPRPGDGGPAGAGAGLPASLVRRFGAEAGEVLAASLLDRPLEPVAPGLDVTRAEFSFHVTHEGALDVSDVLDRRSRVGLVPGDRAAAEPCAREALAAAGL